MEGPSEKVGGAEVNSGPPQIPMPGPIVVRKALLQPVEIEAEEKFTCTIDRIVSKLQELPFLDSQRHNSHPFANLMGWQYIMGGRARAYDPENRTLCLDYAFRITKGADPNTDFLKGRMTTPELAVQNYWELYEDFMTPYDVMHSF